MDLPAPQEQNPTFFRDTSLFEPAGPAGKGEIRAMKRAMILAVLLVASAAYGDVIHVDAGSTHPTPDGTTWSKAFSTIQAAVSVSHSGDLIWVAEGTYNGPVTMKIGTQMYGGFAGNESLLVDRDFAVFRTTITGQGSTTCVTMNENTILDGFVIANGYADELANGSGVLAIQKTGVHIRNIVFTGNSGGFGAAIYAGFSTVGVSNCVMINNTAAYGPVAYAIFSTLTMTNCSASGNTTTELGGGVQAAGATISVFNSVLWNNGAVEVLTSLNGNDVHLDHCVVRELQNQTLTYTREDCLVNEDPLFFNATLFDLRLREDSPCIDAGLEFLSPDIRNIERPQGLGTDIGAYEFLENDPTDSDGDGISDVIEGTDDPDGDQIPNYLDEDSDENGVSDSDEGADDTDGDGIPNYLDDDNDGNGILDIDEGTADTDQDGVFDVSDDDNDGDHIPDYVEGILDRDGDTIVNMNDVDADGDGIEDQYEGAGDPDGDSIPNFLDLDSNGDGISDTDAGMEDGDGDGLPAFVDDDDTVPLVASDLNGDGVINAVDIQLVINLALGINS